MLFVSETGSVTRKESLCGSLPLEIHVRKSKFLLLTELTKISGLDVMIATEKKKLLLCMLCVWYLTVILPSSLAHAILKNTIVKANVCSCRTALVDLSRSGKSRSASYSHIFAYFLKLFPKTWFWIEDTRKSSFSTNRECFFFLIEKIKEKFFYHWIFFVVVACGPVYRVWFRLR